ncbi:MAG: ion transporter [Hoeflea sp. D1-CHI-28]
MSEKKELILERKFLGCGAVGAVSINDTLENWIRNKDQRVQSGAPFSFVNAKRPIFLRLQRFFYPVNSPRAMPRADQLLVWIVIASVFFLIYEGIAWLKEWPISHGLIAASSGVFLLVFGAEFMCRLYLRGVYYLKEWWWIDLTVIVSDAAILSYFFFTYYYGEPESAAAAAIAKILRLLRLFRLLRIAKLIRFIGQRRNLARMARRFSPYPLAVLFTVCWVAFFGICLLLLTSLYFGSDPGMIVRLLYGEVASIIGFLANPGVENPALRIAIMLVALLIAALILNVSGLLFVPILDRLKARRAELENEVFLANHIVICLNDYDSFAGMLEEFIRVFRGYAAREVIVLVSEDTKLPEEDSADSRLRFIKGNLSSVGLWSKAYPDRADAIIVLGEGEIPTDDLPVLIRTADQSELRQVPIFAVSAEGSEVTRKIASGDPLFRVISVSAVELQETVRQMAWDRTSLQYALLNRLIMLFDDKVGFPTLSERTGSTEPAARLEALLASMADDKFTVERNDRFSIRLVPGEENAEVNEVHMMQAVGAALQQDPAAASNTNIFLYVATLDLLRWNDIFAADKNKHVSVFAIELALPLAIYHEMEMPGALDCWVAEKDHLLEFVLAPKRENRWHSASDVAQLLPSDVRENLQVLAIRSGSDRATRHEIFANGINSRIRISSGDVALARPAGDKL